MRAPLIRAVMAIVMFVIVPALGRAQQPATTFRELPRLVGLGEPVVVTDDGGVRIKGTLVEISDSLVVLRSHGKRRDFSPAQVTEIRTPADSVKNGTLWGLLIGTGGGLVIGLGLDASRGEGTWLAPATTLAGAGIGALAGLVGDVSRSNRRVLFRSSSERGSLQLEPIVSRRRVELRGALSFGPAR